MLNSLMSGNKKMKTNRVQSLVKAHLSTCRMTHLGQELMNLAYLSSKVWRLRETVKYNVLE